MSENGGTAPMKFGFGFSKVIKKPNLLANGSSSVKNSNIELIDSIEGSSIKVIGKNPEDEVAKRLVIPMTNDQKSTPLAKLIEDRLKIANNRKIKAERVKKEPEIKQEPLDIKTEPLEETLEQQAARELIEDLKNKVETDDTKVFEVPINPDDLPLEGAAESTMDDYENVPIKDFGMAMLRGMGFKDEDKKEDLSKKPDFDVPVMRPRGMGLGADKVIKKQPLLVAPGATEVLAIKRHACVKVLAGKHKNLYATIEGFDDGGGRVNIKLAIGGLRVTLNEFMVQPVAKQEFAKFGKILNSEKYEEYKSGDKQFTTAVKASASKNELDEPKQLRSRSPERQRKERSRSRSNDKERKTAHKSKDRRGERSEHTSSASKYRGRSRSREKKSKRKSSSSEERSRKKASKHKRKYSSSPDSDRSSDYEKRHKKKTKKSKHKRDRS